MAVSTVGIGGIALLILGGLSLREFALAAPIGAMAGLLVGFLIRSASS